MGYEAQVAGVGDNATGKHVKNTMVRWLKSRSIVEAAKRRQEVVERLNAMNIRLRFVNAGGTGSLDSSRKEAWVTEITAGSGFYAPGLFDHYASFRYKPAAYAVEVVRIPKAGIVTCMGGDTRRREQRIRISWRSPICLKDWSCSRWRAPARCKRQRACPLMSSSTWGSGILSSCEGRGAVRTVQGAVCSVARPYRGRICHLPWNGECFL